MWKTPKNIFSLQTLSAFDKFESSRVKMSGRKRKKAQRLNFLSSLACRCCCHCYHFVSTLCIKLNLKSTVIELTRAKAAPLDAMDQFIDRFMHQQKTNHSLLTFDDVT